MLATITSAMHELEDLEDLLNREDTEPSQKESAKQLIKIRHANAYNLLHELEGDLIKLEKGVGTIIREESWSGLGKMTWTIKDYSISEGEYEVEQYFHASNEENEGVYDRFRCNQAELIKLRDDEEYSWGRPTDWIGSTPLPSIPVPPVVFPLVANGFR